MLFDGATLPPAMLAAQGSGTAIEVRIRPGRQHPQ